MDELKLMKMPPPIDIKLLRSGDDAVVKTVDGVEYYVGDRLERAAHFGFVYGRNNEVEEAGFVVQPQVIAALAKRLIDKGDIKLPTMDEAVAYLRNKGIQTYAYEAKKVRCEEGDADARNWIKNYEVVEEWTPRELADFREKGWA